jgi:nucleotide-binding universal stress UspA family protein
MAETTQTKSEVDMQIRHILLTTDLSTESLRPCRAVVALARVYQARLTLLSVVLEPQLVMQGFPLGSPALPLDVASEVSRVEQALAEQRRALGEGPDVTSAVATGERVDEAVVRYAREHGVDLIALSTHGRTGFKRFALGSVAEQILRRSDVPVLVFPDRC